MSSHLPEGPATPRLDLLESGSSQEFRPAEKCLWCALLYFAVLAVPLAIFRLLL